MQSNRKERWELPALACASLKPAAPRSWHPSFVCTTLPYLALLACFFLFANLFALTFFCVSCLHVNEKKKETQKRRKGESTWRSFSSQRTKQDQAAFAFRRNCHSATAPRKVAQRAKCQCLDCNSSGNQFIHTNPPPNIDDPLCVCHVVLPRGQFSPAIKQSSSGRYYRSFNNKPLNN